jgi:hypothetical protein
MSVKAARFGIVIATLLALNAAYAADKPCTKADAANAEKAVDRVLNWPQLQKAWQDYRHCDADKVAENFTDAVMRMMVDWKAMDALAAAMQKDPEYKAFIYTHINSPAAKDDHEMVYSRARTGCPKGLDEFCAELADTVKPKK